MTMRIPASMRTRQSLSDLIEGRLSTPAGRSELMKLATRLIVEEALEGEAEMRSGGTITNMAPSPARVTATGCAAGA